MTVFSFHGGEEVFVLQDPETWPLWLHLVFWIVVAAYVCLILFVDD